MTPAPPHAPDASAAPARRARRLLNWAEWRMLIYLSWRNVWRNRLRSVLTVSGMVVGMTFIVAYLALIEGMFRQMTGFATDIAIGHLQVHRQAYIDDQDLYALLPQALLKHLRETTPYAYAPRIYAAGLASARDNSSGALLKGIDPEAEARVTDLHKRLRRGTFALEGSRPVYPHGRDADPVPSYPVVIGFQLARNLHVDVGDELVLITQAADGSIGNGLFHIVGVLQSVDPAFDRLGVLMSLKAINSLMFIEDGVHELAVRIPDVNALEAAKDTLTAAVQSWPGSAQLAQDPGGPVRVRTWREINPPLSDMLQQSRSLVLILAFVVCAIAAMGILNTMMMATYERRHELAILLALGMGRGAMMLMVLMEGFVLTALSALVGAGTGSLLSWYLQVEGIDFSAWMPEGLDFVGVVMEPVYYGYLEPSQIVTAVFILLITSLLASLLPSWRTTRLRPALALHQ